MSSYFLFIVTPTHIRRLEQSVAMMKEGLLGAARTSESGLLTLHFRE